MKKLIAVAVAILLPSLAAANDDAENAAKARNELYCGTLNKVLSAQRNGVEEQLASAAAQLTLLNTENATLHDRVALLQRENDEMKAKIAAANQIVDGAAAKAKADDEKSKSQQN